MKSTTTYAQFLAILPFAAPKQWRLLTTNIIWSVFFFLLLFFSVGYLKIIIQTQKDQITFASENWIVGHLFSSVRRPFALNVFTSFLIFVFKPNTRTHTHKETLARAPGSHNTRADSLPHAHMEHIHSLAL
jgi:hypothetical protein